ncbi:MAG TPA: hypothetical protein VIY07_14595 [Pseudolabrys sp.]
MTRDFLGGLACLSGEAFHLLCHHGEPAARLSGAGGLDCRVQRKEICLRRDAADEIADFADLVD